MALSSNNYETTVVIDAFSGLYQGSEQFGTSLKYAADGKNFDVRGGVLKSMTDGAVHVDALLGAPIGTLMLLFRRFTISALSGDNALLIAAAGDKLYARKLNAVATEAWTQIYEGVQNDTFDYVTYEVSTYYTKDGARVAPGTEGSTEVTAANPIDILVMSNGDDGMLIVYGDDLSVVHYVVQPDPQKPEKKFGVLARHAERIWGGAIPDQPDMLMYSATYDPLDWAQRSGEALADGAGDIQQPSWDGDSFVALRTYGSYLLAIKKNRIWRVSGTNPGEYYFKEQYGGGTLVENTCVVYNDYMFMLGYDGLMVYDGTAVQEFRRPYLQELMKRVNWAHADVACAAMRGTVYCLALPLDDSEINNAILEYAATEKTFALREGVYVSSFLEYGDALYYTDPRDNANVPSGRVLRLDDSGSVLPMRYVTAWQDLGYKSLTKSGFEVYLCADQAITVTIGMRSEKKLKTRTVTLAPNKAKRVRLNVQGRQFRLELEIPTPDTGITAWKINGGIQINMELDWD